MANIIIKTPKELTSHLYVGFNPNNFWMDQNRNNSLKNVVDFKFDKDNKRH